VPTPGAELALVTPPEGWLRIRALVVDAVSSPHSRRAYGQALDDFFAWLNDRQQVVFSRALVQEYRAGLIAAGLAPSTINLRLAALRKLAWEASENGWLAPEAAASVARVKGVRRLGVRTGNWLTREQAAELLRSPDPATLKGKRDRAILALLLACGLRRAEVARLTVAAFELREGRWVLPDLESKGGRLRTVPVPGWVKALADAWTEAAQIGAGPLFRPVAKGSAVRSRPLTEKAVWCVVREYAARLGLPRLAPHDLRRTCAHLCRAAGGDLEQIQFLLGHASIQTTERYLGSRQNLAAAVNDRLDFTLDE